MTTLATGWTGTLRGTLRHHRDGAAHLPIPGAKALGLPQVLDGTNQVASIETQLGQYEVRSKEIVSFGNETTQFGFAPDDPAPP